MCCGVQRRWVGSVSLAAAVRIVLHGREKLGSELQVQSTRHRPTDGPWRFGEFVFIFFYCAFLDVIFAIVKLAFFSRGKNKNIVVLAWRPASIIWLKIREICFDLDANACSVTTCKTATYCSLFSSSGPIWMQRMADRGVIEICFKRLKQTGDRATRIDSSRSFLLSYDMYHPGYNPSLIAKCRRRLPLLTIAVAVDMSYCSPLRLIPGERWQFCSRMKNNSVEVELFHCSNSIP